MYKVKSLKQICSIPSEWNGYTNKNEIIHIRFRNGFLIVEVEGETKIAKDIKAQFPGNSLTDTQMKDQVKEVLSFN